jgi:hypothetical protein
MTPPFPCRDEYSTQVEFLRAEEKHLRSNYGAWNDLIPEKAWKVAEYIEAQLRAHDIEFGMTIRNETRDGPVFIGVDIGDAKIIVYDDLCGGYRAHRYRRNKDAAIDVDGAIGGSVATGRRVWGYNVDPQVSPDGNAWTVAEAVEWLVKEASH